MTMETWRRARAVVVTGLVALTSVVVGAVSGPAPVVSADASTTTDEYPDGRAIALGATQTCVIERDGDVLCWGENDSGQLGYGDTAARGGTAGSMASLVPVALGAGRKAAAITAGANHTCALLDNATVKCWGEGGTGALGYGDRRDRGDDAGEMGSSLPAVDLGRRTPVALSAGNGFTCALFVTGQVACWGAGQNGRLGIGSTANIGDGPGEMGSDLRIVPLGRRATAISAGSNFACALLLSGEVTCWGRGATGALGLGITQDLGDERGEVAPDLPVIDLGTDAMVVALSAGKDHVCAAFDDDTVKCWGDNRLGQLGRSSGDGIIGDERSEMGGALPVVDIGNSGMPVVSVSAGWGHSCAVVGGMGVKCWGSSGNGELGYGDQETRNRPIQMGANLPYVNVGSSSVQGVEAAGGNTCVALATGGFAGRVACWGAGSFSQLGVDSTEDLADEPDEVGDGLALAITGDLFPLSAELVAEVTDVTIVGETIQYRFGLRSPSFRLTPEWRIESNAPDCERDSVVPNDIVTTFTCEYTVRATDPNTFVTWVKAIGPTGAFDIDWFPTVILRSRPDGMSGPGDDRYVGQEIYGGPRRQTATDRVRLGRSQDFQVLVYNASPFPERFTATGQGSTERFRVRYLHRGDDVTRQVVAGTWRTPRLSPDTWAVLKVVVTPTRRAQVDDRLLRTVRFAGYRDVRQTDTVGVAVRVVA